MRIIGSALVHNEDVFVEQAIRNVAQFCDRIFVVDHMSSDRTPEILRALAREFDHLELRRARHSRVSHELLEPYIGTETWVLRVDGDELYDPGGLGQMRESLESGAHDGAFRLLGNVLHVVELDDERRIASGYLSPPSRPISALYNLAALESWSGGPERLHAGHIVYRGGYNWHSFDRVYERFAWNESPLRCLHVCFLRRSSRNGSAGSRGNLGELGMYRRSAFGRVERAVRRFAGRPAGDPAQVEMRARNSSWKDEKYRRGELVTVDASAFVPAA